MLLVMVIKKVLVSNHSLYIIHVVVGDLGGGGGGGSGGAVAFCLDANLFII